MNILVTGAAGFIGYFTCLRLIENGNKVFGIDNINDYYSQKLKWDRLHNLGINKFDLESTVNKIQSKIHPRFHFAKIDLSQKEEVENIFKSNQFDVVCNLAAQAGVRYSIENPHAYIQSNIVGFMNILEGCRNSGVKHLIYASSSSVYGNNLKVPFEVNDCVDHPISLYAATKKSNELMAHSYSHLYNFATTGIRFFTVYGPWGRPDMAYFLFTKAINSGKPIKVFNGGDMERDFTYIDDIIQGLIRVIETPIRERKAYKIYNIGNSETIKISEFINTIEKALGKKAEKIMLPMQAGDVSKTWASLDDFFQDYQFRPKTKIKDGINKFVLWYKEYTS